ncbi:MAG TPA: hypothetical protein VHE61_11235, partial [Opitutaceae bacterium]|nr:hypothetical protein [Opitutaceae bacterium]
AVISAIAICVASNRAAAAWHPAPNSALVTGLTSDALPGGFGVVHALDTGDQTYRDVADGFTALPPELLEADWIRAPDRARTAVADRVLQFSVTRDATVYVAHAATGGALPRWLSGWERTKLILATNAAPGVSFALFRQDVRAGSSLSLGRNTTTGDPSTPMYTVFVVPRRPAPPAQMVRDLTAATAAPASAAQAEPRPDRHGVRATGDLQVGREIYPDSDTRVASLPATLTDCDLVSPSSEGKRGISFSVSAEVEVYVALDSRIEQRPAWLADWIVTRDTIMTTGTFSGRFVLVHHRFTPGQRVELGANGTLPSGAPAAMYFVIVRAVRPALHLDAEDASLRGAFVLNRAGNTGHGAVSLPAGAGHVITWTVPVGVGDRYGLDFRFTASTPCGPTPARLTIVDAEGHVLRTDKLTFPAVPDSARWTHLRTRTGSSINAGTYEFRLTLTGPSPLIIDSLEVE